MKALLQILTDPLINISALERAIDAPKGTIRVALSDASDKKIPEKWLFPIVRELARLGITLDGWRIRYDEETRLLFISRPLEDIEPEVIDHENWFEYRVSESRDMLDGCGLIEWLETE